MSSNRGSRRGLTLLELIVVLVILVAVAGIVIPLLPDQVMRAHTSVGATNTSEIGRLVQVYYRTYQAFPSELDNLASDSGVIDYLPGSTLGQLVKTTLTPEQATALVNVGILELAELHPTKAALTAAGGTPTFAPYKTSASAAPLAVGSGIAVATLTEEAVELTSGLVRDKAANIGDVYVVFGLGKRSNAIGSLLSDAPVHFGKLSSTRAGSAYCRYGLVFRVTRGGATSTTLNQAAFMGVVSFQDNGIVATDGQLADYYDSISK